MRRELALIAVILILSACATVPITGRSQLILVSEAQDMALGLQAYRQILRKEPVTQDPRALDPVHRIASRLVAVADRPDFDWEVNVIHDARTVNAFALPGGKIAIYTGIFPIAQTEAGLAIIIGHEVGHAIARHGAERISQGLLVELAGTALEVAVETSPHAGAILAAYGLGVQVGVLLPYSRVHESEADQIGLVLAAKAGYDPRVALDVWRRMAALSDRRPPEFLSTHPNPETRLVEIEQALPEALAQFRPHPDAGNTPLPPPEAIRRLR